MTTRTSRPAPLLSATLAAVAFSAACRDGIVPANAIMHPTEENLPAPGGPLIRADTALDGASSPERSAEWAETRRALLDAEVVASIGAATGDGPDVLGIVGDAAVDEEGNVYIQENTTDELLVFSQSGDLLHRTGGTGDGPEEFRGINGFVRLADGRLVVAHDGGTPKVLTPRPRGYGYRGPLLADRGTMPPAVIDMCAVGDRLFLHATNLHSNDPGAHRVIHEVAVSGGHIANQLAEGYRSEHWRDRERRSYGSIACVEAVEGARVTLVWGLYYFPIVKAYRPGDTLLWTALIEDFEQGLVYQNKRNTVSVHPRTASQEYISVTHALRGGFVVAQSVHYGMEWDEEEQTSSMPLLRLRTYLIDAETGNGGLVGEDLPWIAWIGDSSFITIRSLPYPKLEVRALASTSSYKTTLSTPNSSN